MNTIRRSLSVRGLAIAIVALAGCTKHEPPAPFTQSSAGAPKPNESAATGAPISPSPVPADFILDVLEPWIAAGAPNN